MIPGASGLARFAGRSGARQGVSLLGREGLDRTGSRRLGAIHVACRVAFAVLALAGGGCGYSLGYRTPPSVARIAVPIFDNQTFPLRREVELELTRAFREEIQSRTSLILTTEADADMVVYGTVNDFEERVVAEGPRDEKI